MLRLLVVLATAWLVDATPADYPSFYFQKRRRFRRSRHTFQRELSSHNASNTTPSPTTPTPSPPTPSSNTTNTTSSNATAAPAPTPTEAPATAAPATAAPATAAPATAAPATAAPATAAPTKDGDGEKVPETDGEGQDGEEDVVVEAKVVETALSADLELDLTQYTDTEKTAIGGGVAFGLHKSFCDAIQGTLTDTLQNCFAGETVSEEVELGAELAISDLLVTSQPVCDSATNCYGGDFEEPAPRRLAAETVSNSGNFMIRATGTAAADNTMDTAVTTINTARNSGALAASSIQDALVEAFERPAFTDNVDAAKIADLKTAAQTASVSVAEPTVTVQTQAPTPVVPPVGDDAEGSVSSAFTQCASLAIAVAFISSFM